MHQPTRRARKLSAVIASPIAIVVAGALIWQSSHAAFSGTTRNSGNNWSTGSVALTDDDSGAARFQVSRMTPGQTETKCISVTANATVPGVVRGYAVNPVLSSANLQDHVKVAIRYGSGGGFGSCDGFVGTGTAVPETSLTALASFNSWATGAGSWPVVAGTQTRTYEITWRFDVAGLSQSQLDNLQGTQTGIDLQWELQSN
jgi:hypothetical protein